MEDAQGLHKLSPNSTLKAAKSLNDIRKYLNEVEEDNSLPGLVIFGHGGNGGCGFSPVTGRDDMDGEDLLRPRNKDLVDLIKRKLTNDARLYVFGCQQWTTGPNNLQLLAQEINRNIVASHGNFVGIGVDCYTSGFWVELFPQRNPKDWQIRSGPDFEAVTPYEKRK